MMLRKGILIKSKRLITLQGKDLIHTPHFTGCVLHIGMNICKCHVCITSRPHIEKVGGPLLRRTRKATKRRPPPPNNRVLSTKGTNQDG